MFVLPVGKKYLTLPYGAARPPSNSEPLTTSRRGLSDLHFRSDSIMIRNSAAAMMTR